MNGEWMLHAGIIVMSAAAVIIGILLIVFGHKKKKLDLELTREYGPKRH